MRRDRLPTTEIGVRVVLYRTKGAARELRRAAPQSLSSPTADRPKPGPVYPEHVSGRTARSPTLLLLLLAMLMLASIAERDRPRRAGGGGCSRSISPGSLSVAGAGRCRQRRRSRACPSEGSWEAMRAAPAAGRARWSTTSAPAAGSRSPSQSVAEALPSSPLATTSPANVTPLHPRGAGGGGGDPPAVAARGGGGGGEQRSRGSGPTSCRLDDVGGMEELKQEVRDTVGLIARAPGRSRALRHRVERHPAPRPAGRRQDVLRAGDRRRVRPEPHPRLDRRPRRRLVGQSAQNIDKAFQTALDNLPCLLFFDEFDSVAQRRDTTPRPGVAPHRQPAAHVARGAPRRATSCSSWRRRTRSSTSTRPSSGPVASTATSASTCRTPRRRAIFEAELDDRPTAPDVDLDELVRRTEGMTPAAIEKVVDTAALDGVPEAPDRPEVRLDTEHLLGAIERSAARTGRPSSTGRGTRSSCPRRSRRSCSSCRR